MAKKTKFW